MQLTSCMPVGFRSGTGGCSSLTDMIDPMCSLLRDKAGAVR